MGQPAEFVVVRRFDPLGVVVVFFRVKEARRRNDGRSVLKPVRGNAAPIQVRADGKDVVRDRVAPRALPAAHHGHERRHAALVEEMAAHEGGRSDVRLVTSGTAGALDRRQARLADKGRATFEEAKRSNARRRFLCRLADPAHNAPFEEGDPLVHAPLAWQLPEERIERAQCFDGDVIAVTSSEEVHFVLVEEAIANLQKALKPRRLLREVGERLPSVLYRDAVQERRQVGGLKPNRGASAQTRVGRDFAEKLRAAL